MSQLESTLERVPPEQPAGPTGRSRRKWIVRCLTIIGIVSLLVFLFLEAGGLWREWSLLQGSAKIEDVRSPKSGRRLSGRRPRRGIDADRPHVWFRRRRRRVSRSCGRTGELAVSGINGFISRRATSIGLGSFGLHRTLSHVPSTFRWSKPTAEKSGSEFRRTPPSWASTCKGAHAFIHSWSPGQGSSHQRRRSKTTRS